MNAVMPKAELSPLRVAVLSRDPMRKNRLLQWLHAAGHDQAASTSDASVVLSDGLEVETAVPVVALGMVHEDYAARLPRDASPEQIDAALRAVAVGLLVTAPGDAGGRFGDSREDDEAPLLTPREI